MLLTFDEASNLINDGKLLHIAGTEELLRKLPKGRWIGGSTEYFMTQEGGKVSNDKLFVTLLPFKTFLIQNYDSAEISNIASNAYENGFSIVIVPFDSEVHKVYAQKAAGFQEMFLKNIVGWIAGINLAASGQTPIAVDGRTGAAFSDRAVTLHICVPDDKTANIGIVNIFEQDENSPVIEFEEESFFVRKCLVDGKEADLAEYIEKNNIDTKLPLVGDYSGTGINISFKSIDNGTVYFYAPVFRGIKYRIAKSISDYSAEFGSRLAAFKNTQAAFSCNCILNFLYGELDGKRLDVFAGPITFGEIAYQLVNQTLVYVTVD